MDTYRYLYPEKENAYTWWSYMANSRARNIGWRIDYFITSKRIAKNIEEAKEKFAQVLKKGDTLLIENDLPDNYL